MNEIDIKEAYKTLDRDNFDQVCALVDSIVDDIKDVNDIDQEMGFALVKDYMISLINPSLLDFE